MTNGQPQLAQKGVTTGAKGNHRQTGIAHGFQQTGFGLPLVASAGVISDDDQVKSGKVGQRANLLRGGGFGPGRAPTGDEGQHDLEGLGYRRAAKAKWLCRKTIGIEQVGERLCGRRIATVEIRDAHGAIGGGGRCLGGAHCCGRQHDLAD